MPASQLVRPRIARALMVVSLTSIILFVIRAASFQSMNFWYLNWNLILAWLPLLFADLMDKQLNQKTWNPLKIVVFGLLWLGFLPNSFYLVTDFIHLQESGSRTLLFDVLLLFSFALTGLALGYASVYLVHNQLKKYLQKPIPQVLIAVTFLLCSFAIYLGRYLRWNTWDILFNPASLLFDVSDRFINPRQYEQTFVTTALFFLFISALYIAFYQLCSFSKPQKPKRLAKSFKK